MLGLAVQSVWCKAQSMGTMMKEKKETRSLRILVLAALLAATIPRLGIAAPASRHKHRFLAASRCENRSYRRNNKLSVYTSKLNLLYKYDRIEQCNIRR